MAGTNITPSILAMSEGEAFPEIAGIKPMKKAIAA